MPESAAEARITGINVPAMVAAVLADSDEADVDVLVGEVEEAVLAQAKTIKATVALYRPLLAHAVNQGLRGRMRAIEDEVLPRAEKGGNDDDDDEDDHEGDREEEEQEPVTPRKLQRRAGRRRVTVNSERPEITKLRDKLAVQNLNRLARCTFKPSRGAPDVFWFDASADDHDERARGQQRLAGSIKDDVYRHRLFAAAIRACEGAANFHDVRRAWGI